MKTECERVDMGGLGCHSFYQPSLVAVGKSSPEQRLVVASQRVNWSKRRSR